MTTDDLTVRRYRQEDADEARAVHEAALRASPVESVPDAVDVDLRAFEPTYLDGRGTFLVGVHDGDVVATGGYRRADDATAELRHLRVAPDRQRRGFGSRLVTDLEIHAKRAGVGVVVLETHAALAAARRLYEERGYYRVPGDPHGTPDGAVRYRRELGYP